MLRKSGPTRRNKTRNEIRKILVQIVFQSELELLDENDWLHLDADSGAELEEQRVETGVQLTEDRFMFCTSLQLLVCTFNTLEKGKMSHISSMANTFS